VKLLRVLQEGEFERVGDTRTQKVDTRFIAATNRDLEREVNRERFRKDLYFRLAVIVLHLPPLRERGEDVLLLAEHFLRAFNAKYGKAVREISAPARELLLAYPWPGNVRELSHVIERAVLWSRGPTLEAEHLSLTRPDSARPPEPEPRDAPPPARRRRPGAVGESAHRAGAARGRRQPDQSGTATRDFARHPALPLEEVRPGWVISPTFG
jgi:two-component system response regulator HydG